jgi:hypothetical protein
LLLPSTGQLLLVPLFWHAAIMPIYFPSTVFVTALSVNMRNVYYIRVFWLPLLITWMLERHSLRKSYCHVYAMQFYNLLLSFSLTLMFIYYRLVRTSIISWNKLCENNRRV